MTFKDNLLKFCSDVLQYKDIVETEEATKNSLIMPFIDLLGYDTRNPLVVVPEYTADVGIKKGEKVDYAILNENKEPIILIEAKQSNAKLTSDNINQLHRYFNTKPTAKIAILTNGVIYQFFTDLDSTNCLDQKPFMVFDIENPNSNLIPELEKLCKDNFDSENAKQTAENLRYNLELKALINNHLTLPDDDYIKFLIPNVYSGNITKTVVEKFRPIINKVIKTYIDELLDKRLDAAKTPVKDENEAETEAQNEDSDEQKIVTTEIEIEGYYIIKSILSELVDSERVTIRDTISYCGVLLDDNNRKPLARLHFNRSQLYLGLLDNNKEEERLPIDKPKDIYKYSDRIKKTLKQYIEPSTNQQNENTSNE